MENGSSCSRMPSDWLRMAVLDCRPSVTSRLPRKVGLVVGQAVLGLHVGDKAAARVRRLATKPHLGAHDQVAIQQPTQAHQHDGAVRGDIAQLVGRAGLGGDHPAIALGRLALLQAHLPAAADQQLADALGGGPGALARQRGAGLVVKGLQALRADVFLVVAQVGQVLGGCGAQCTARY